VPNEGAVGLSAAASLTSEQKAKIDEILERWNSVQGRLKRAEQISQVAVIPAVNELRYAGRMLVGMLTHTVGTRENGLPAIDDAIIIASQYLTNAQHDISDALLYFYQKKVDDLNLRYGQAAITKEFAAYKEVNLFLKEARQLVINSRADMGARKDNYAKLEELSEKISENYFVLIDSEVLFALEVEHYRSRILIWKIVSSGLAILSAGLIFFLAS